MTAPLCDLVLLSWNHLELTQRCLETLFLTTDVPCRLLIVDNGSEASVRSFLRGVRPRGAIQEVAVLQHETNEGFPRGMNRGIEASDAPFVCLLNNDLRFTSGWLQGMIEVAAAHPEVGIVNPSSNTFGDVPRGRGGSIEEHAHRLRRLAGRYTEVGMCIGFCMLIKRGVVEAVGGLSEEVERIFFEDEDYCMRAQQAGFRCVIASASYVYHAEHQTVKRMPEREALFARNQRWCHGRWGRWVRLAWPRFQPIVPGSEELRRWLERLVGWARRRAHVYAYCPSPAGATKEAAFSSVGLIPHADLHWHAVPEGLPGWVSAGLILKRRKKPFDIIVAPSGGWGRTMERLGWVHRAAVVREWDEDTLERQWRQRSRSPSSS